MVLAKFTHILFRRGAISRERNDDFTRAWSSSQVGLIEWRKMTALWFTISYQFVRSHESTFGEAGSAEKEMNGYASGSGSRKAVAAGFRRERRPFNRWL